MNNRLKVKVLKELAIEGLVEEYKNLTLSDSQNYNETFFNTNTYRLNEILKKKEVSFNLLNFLLKNSLVDKSIITQIKVKNEKDALDIFINYSDYAIGNYNLLKIINRKDYSDWFFNDTSNTTAEHIRLALKMHLINGDQLYDILDKDKTKYSRFFGHNPESGYADEEIINLIKNTNIYKNEKIENIKTTILNYIEVTIKRNLFSEMVFLYRILFSRYVDKFYYMNFNPLMQVNTNEKLIDIKLEYKNIFDSEYKELKENFSYSGIFKFLSLSEKKTMIDSLLDINLDFFEKYFYYANDNFFRLTEYYLNNSNNDRAEIEYYYLTKLFDNKKLLDLVIKDNRLGLTILFILNKKFFKKIENDNEFLKKIFVYNNKVHYIFSRIYPDHELSKGNYNPEACYGNIWQEECSNCLFYLERNLNLVTRCSKKYTSLLDIKTDEVNKTINRDQLISKFGKDVGTLINNN